MKKASILAAFVFCAVAMFAQHIPLGMKYQAVARDDKGNVLANKEITLRINLNSQTNAAGEPYYTETHSVSTNKLGLFTLVLGEGQEKKGAFSKVPWSTDDIWMEVSINDKQNTDFSVVSNSRLLAVPYAFHAATASQIVGGSQRQDGSPGSPSNNWITYGNSGTNPEIDRLGTADNVDLVMITNNTERLRILANGNINIANDLTIGKDLHVKENTYLNEDAGQTINYGPFTVDRQSPTLLSGKLTVDLATDLNSSLNVDGITNLNSHLNVNYMSPSHLSGTLTVDGITDLNAALNVNNMSPTTLTGILNVKKTSDFEDSVLISEGLQSYTPSTGALVVTGGHGIGGNLNVGGDSKFGGATEFAGAVLISDVTQSTSTTTGALKVGGGVGIGKRLNVGEGTLLGSTLGVTGATTLSSTLGVAGATTLGNTLSVVGATALGNSLTVTGASQLNSTLGVTGISSITNNTQSTSIGTGALIVSGGAGIGLNLFVGGDMTVAGSTNMNGGLAVTKSAPGADVATFENTGDGNGISIKVAKAIPANANNYISFKNSSGTVVGRVEGETQTEMVNSDSYKSSIANFDLTIALAGINVATAAIDVVLATSGLVAASTSVTPCAGLGFCVTAPVPSLIVQAVINLAARIANLVSVSIGLDQSIKAKNSWVTEKTNSRGVTYASGAGDYAEWLPKSSEGETFLPGAIVGVKNGLISMDTKDASQLLVISTKPFMLGNMPDPEHEAQYEKVAFMGQVPTLVAGIVHIGDYILPNGLNNGIGIAKSAAQMQTADYANIVGIAWSASSELMGKVNVAIGINHNEVSAVVKKQEALINAQDEKIAALEMQMKETRELLSKLTPAFGAPKDNLSVKEIAIPKSLPQPSVANTINPASSVTPRHVTEAEIIYFDVTRQQIELGFEKAEQMFNDAKIKTPTEVTFWKKYHADAGYRNSILAETQAKVKTAFHWHKDIDHELAR